MNNKQQNILRGLLKKYEYKNVSNVVRQVLGINFDNFLNKTEPLYVIPRIASCYAEEEKKQQLTTIVYKEWLKNVVDNRWVTKLNAYSLVHGERTVLQAIYYLMDNGLWNVYEGRLALDAHESNYYDMLEDMPSAIGKIEEDQAKDNKHQEEAKPEAEKEQPTPDVLMDADEAMKLMDATKTMYADLTKNMEKLTDFIYSAADSDSLRAKIQEQAKRIKDMEARAENTTATLQKQNNYISELRTKSEEAQKEYDILNAKYKKALDERDAADRELEACKKLLDEEAQKEQLPRKRVIPRSILMAVPLLGNGVLKGLEPVLNRYGLIVEHNQ